MKNITKYLTLFLIGAAIYFEVELNWRYAFGHLPVHLSMPLLGGLLFVLLGGFNNWIQWEVPLIMQAALGAAICTEAEFLAGCVLNLWLNLGVWDYSHIPFNFLGQVCLPFSLAWFFLATIAIVLDDWLRYWIWREERPHYVLW